MTLIEIMIAYRDKVWQHGRESGSKFLDGVLTDVSLKQPIIDSVSNEGYFIDSCGQHYLL